MPEPTDPQPQDAAPPGPDATTPQPDAAGDDGADRAMEQALDGAKASLSEIEAELADAGDDGSAPGAAPAGGTAEGDDTDPGIELLGDVDLDVTIQLGRTEMLLEDVLRLGEGSVVELDKLAGDPVDVFVNGRLVARGEVLVLNDNFCIRISEIVANLEEQAAAAAQEQEQAAAAATN